MAESSSATKRKLPQDAPEDASVSSPSQQDNVSESSQRKRTKESYLELCLTNEGYAALLSRDKDKRLPLLFNDVTRLIMECQFGSMSPSRTRMCVIEGTLAKKSVIVYIDNCPPLDSTQFCLHESFSALNFELVSESHCSIDWKRELSFLALMTSHCQVLLENYRNLKVACIQEDDVLGFLSMEYPINLDDTDDTSVRKNEKDNFNRTHLLLNVSHMQYYNYPIPRRCSDYSLTHGEYVKATSESPLFAIDCEFVCTDQNSHELAEIAVVNEDLEIVFYSLVKPENKVIDYLTAYSGITEERLKNINTRLQDVQTKLKEILPNNGIIVGHSFDNDMRVLKVLHPYLMDSSVFYNDSGSFNKRSKLKTLAKDYLNLEIQSDLKKGHSAAEDARATMGLAKHKLLHDITYGNTTLDMSRTERSKGFKEFIAGKGQTTIFGNETSIKIFKRHITSIAINKYSQEVNPEEDYDYDKVKCVVEEHPDLLIQKLCDTLPNADLLIGNIVLQDPDQFLSVFQKWESEILSKVSEKTVIVFIFGDSSKRQAPRTCRILV